MEDIHPYYDKVEEAITLSGVDPVLSRSATEGQWNLKKEGIEVWIDVLPIEQNQRTYLQVMSPIVQAPQDNKEAFYSWLLETNYQMIDACLCTFQDGVYLKIMREIEHLAPHDILLAIMRVGYYAGVNEKELIEKFQAGKIKLQD